MHHFLILTNRHDKVLHGIVCSEAELRSFDPVRADWFAEKYNLTKCIYHESFERENEALNRLNTFSKWSRAKKMALIDQSNPGRYDLTVRVMRRKEHF